MTPRLNSLSIFFLALVWIIKCSASVNVTSSGVNLNVSYTYIPETSSWVKIINCSLNASLVHWKTVASLTVFGSVSNGSQDKFEELAVVDRWYKKPKLSLELEDIDIVVTGKIGKRKISSSNVMLSWETCIPKDWRLYKCVANGLDSMNKAQSLFVTVTAEPPDLLRSCGDATSSGSLVTDKKLQLLWEKLKHVDEAVDKVLEHVQALRDKSRAPESKLENFTQPVACQLKMAALSCDWNVSTCFRNHVYAVSKREESFNIQNAQVACNATGGYLLEIEDDEEVQFLLDFLKSVRGSDTFMTGGYRIDEMRSFVYFNSWKPVPFLNVWSVDQPNNCGGHQFCLAISLSLGGLNDVVCNKKGKIVCKVPISDEQ